MTYEPLHHKYRPQTFAQLVGQSAIASTLINAINLEKIAPAYLFTGPRGTGKTSSARILAKSLNCLSSQKPTPEPCGKCNVCQSIARSSALDVIEIDAASNTGVDNIREIIEKSQFAPVQCRYKVYVIDECHMLSTAAFNALLKTLEEPPGRVIFVLATTDPQRVLPTIISRCQRFDYRRIPLQEMSAHLGFIAQQEDINITEEALNLIAQIANGGLRDAESLLDQLSLLPTEIDTEKVWDLVGAVPEQDLLSLIKAIASDQIDLVLTQCRKLMDRGREPLIVLQNLANFYVNLLIAKNAPNRSDLIAVTDKTWDLLCQEAKKWDTNLILQGQKTLKDSEVQLRNTTQPRLWLEVTLLNLLPSALQTPIIVDNAKSSTIIKEENKSANVNNNKDLLTKQPLSPLKEKTSFPPQSSPPSDNNSQQKTNFTEKILPSSEKNFSQKTDSSQKPPTPLTTKEEILVKKSLDGKSFDDIWQSVLQKVSPMTKALLNQHCRLIDFDGKAAVIGVTNESLLKVATGKSKDIEVAFQKVYNSQVIIKLIVNNSSKITSKKINNELSKNNSFNEKINNSNNEVQTQTNNQTKPDSKSELTLERNLGKEINTNSVEEIESSEEDKIKRNLTSENQDTDEPNYLVISPKNMENILKFFQGEIVDIQAKKEEDIPF